MATWRNWDVEKNAREASVRPILLYRWVGREGRFSIENRGIGPALIKKSYLTFAGETARLNGNIDYKNNKTVLLIDNALQKFAMSSISIADKYPGGSRPGLTLSKPSEGFVIPPGGRHDFILFTDWQRWVDFVESKADQEIFQRVIDNYKLQYSFKIEIEYCTISELTCWNYSWNDTVEGNESRLVSK